MLIFCNDHMHHRNSSFSFIYLWCWLLLGFRCSVKSWCDVFLQILPIHCHFSGPLHGVQLHRVGCKRQWRTSGQLCCDQRGWEEFNLYFGGYNFILCFSLPAIATVFFGIWLFCLLIMAIFPALRCRQIHEPSHTNSVSFQLHFLVQIQECRLLHAAGSPMLIILHEHFKPYVVNSSLSIEQELECFEKWLASIEKEGLVTSSSQVHCSKCHAN